MGSSACECLSFCQSARQLPVFSNTFLFFFPTQRERERKVDQDVGEKVSEREARRGKAGRHGARRSGDPSRFRVARGPAASGMRPAVLSRLLSGAKLTQVVEGPQHLIQECLRARRLC